MRLRDVARALGCELRGDGDVDIRDVASIEEAEPGTLTFLADARLANKLAVTRASAVVLPPEAEDGGLPSLRAAHPYLAFVGAIELFHPASTPPAGVHATAVVAADAAVGEGSWIGPQVVIGERVTIGRGAVLHARVTIYPDVRIGDRFTAHAGSVVREGVRIGDRVTLQSGAVVGGDGFGYLPLPEGNRRIPHIGTVVLEDDVEIGSNATVDRAALGATVIGRGTKIDNLVMIAHGCRLGPGCLLAAQVGLAGSTIVGTRVMMAGQVGVSGHITVGDGAQIAAKAGVHQDIPAGVAFGGIPAMEIRRWRRVVNAYIQLPEILRRLRRVERALGLRAAAEPE